MTAVKIISQLVAADTLSASDVIPVEQSGVTRKATVEQIASATVLAEVVASGSTTPRTLADRFGEVKNAKDFGAVGDGTTDDTAAIHAAVASGSRYVSFLGGLSFSAPSLSDDLCKDCIFIGDGSKLVNLPAGSRKLIAPLSAGSPPAPVGGINPAANLAGLIGKTTAKVIFVGDSHSTWTAHGIYTEPGEIALIADKMKSDNPSIAFTFLNYGIGGTTIANWIGYNNSGAPGWTPDAYPAWWTDHTQNWLYQVQQQAPDVVVWIRGTNEINITTTLLYNSCISALASMIGWAKYPSQIMCPSPIRSIFGGPTSSNLEESYTHMLRTFALAYGFGLLDFSRQSCIVRDGFDPLSGTNYVPGSWSQGTGQPLPMTLPGPTRDYGAYFIDFGTPGQPALSTFGEFTFPLSGVTGDAFHIGRDSGTGNLYYSSTVSGQAYASRTVTGVSGNYQTTGSRLEIYFALHGTQLLVLTNGPEGANVVFNGTIMRFGGAFTPVITCSGSATSIYTGLISVSSPKITIPVYTDTELWGLGPTSTPGVDFYGGDSHVHPSTRMISAVYLPVLRGVNMSVSGVVIPGSGIGQVLGPLVNYQGSGIPGLALPGRTIVSRSISATATDYADFEIQRGASYTGGNSGQINAAFRVSTTIASTASANEWNVVNIVSTNGTGGGIGLATFNQANRLAGATDAIIGVVTEVQDQGGVASSVTPNGVVSQEMDLRANRADDGTNGASFGGVGVRKGLNIQVGRYNSADTTQTEFSNGIWFSQRLRTGSPDTLSNYGSAIGFALNTQIRSGLDTRGAITPAGSSNPVSAVNMTAGHVIDFSGGAALNSAPGRPMAYNSGTTALEYKSGSTVLFSVSDVGAISTSGSAVVAGGLSAGFAIKAGTGLAAFNQTPPASRPTITGSRGSATAAVLTQLLTALSATGIILDSTTA